MMGREDILKDSIKEENWKSSKEYKNNLRII